MRRRFLAIISLLVVVVSGVEKGCVQCPPEDGTYPHPTRYNAFVRCVDGAAQFEDCPEGTIFLKDRQSCGRQLTKNILRASRLAALALSSCSKRSYGNQGRVEPYYSSSTSTSGACAQGCSAYEGFTEGTEIHSVCREESEQTCKNEILARGLSADYGNDMVQAHNVKRNLLAGGQASSKGVGTLPPASNMIEFVFNGELAKVAQAWTDLCIMGHDCNNCRKITSDSQSPVGQNGYYAFNFENTPPHPESVVDAWWSEIDDLTTLDTIQSFSSEDINVGHFTQEAWADTFQIGCGWTVEAPDDDGGWNIHYFTCNYDSAGNFLGEPVYKEGPPATDCQYGRKNSGSVNTLAYENLCNPLPISDPCEESQNF